MSELHIKECENIFLINISWGDDWERTVHKKLFVRHLNTFHKCSAKEEFLATFHEIELRIAHSETLRLLARKGYFKFELQQKLLLKGLSEGAVSQAISKFEQQGYLNDEERIEGVIRRELKKGHGPQVIEQLLKQKNLAIDNYRSLIASEEKRALQAYIQKRSLKAEKQDRAQKQKLIAKLLRRGFSYTTIQSVLKSSFE